MDTHLSTAATAYAPVHIGVYICETLYRVGGTEGYTANLVATLQNIYKKAVIHFITELYDRNDIITSQDFIKRQNKLYGLTIDPNRVSLQAIPCSRENALTQRIMYWKIEQASKKYDLFFYCSRGCYTFKAKKNIAIIHFPVHTICDEKKQAGSFIIPFKNAYKDKKYNKAYSYFLPNSHFTEHWLKKYRPDIADSKITTLYPCINPIPKLDFPKEKAIMICSRIERSKKIEFLIDTFVKSDYLSKNYVLWIIGNQDPDAHGYIDELKQLSAGKNVQFFVSVSHDTLVEMYNKASFFWHAKGLLVDENKNPEQMEHFGMTTVEAMSAGCIPIVINKGGQPEIVTEGTGYTWNTLDELKTYTEELAKDPQKCEKYRQAAINRSKYFSKEMFESNLRALLNV